MMIEKAARALCLSLFGDESVHGQQRCCYAGGGAEGCCIEEMRGHVRAVLQVLREPDEDLIDAGAVAQAAPYPSPTEGDRQNAKETFTAMIDHILNESKSDAES